MAADAGPIGATTTSLVSWRGPVGAAALRGLSGSGELKIDSLGFRQRSRAGSTIGVNPALSEAADERTDACRRTATPDLATEPMPTFWIPELTAPHSWSQQAVPLLPE